MGAHTPTSIALGRLARVVLPLAIIITLGTFALAAIGAEDASPDPTLSQDDSDTAVYSSLVQSAADAVSRGELAEAQIIEQQARTHLELHPDLAQDIQRIESSKARIITYCPLCAHDITPPQIERYNNATMLLLNLYEATIDLSTHRSLRRFGTNASARTINPEIAKRSRTRATIQEAQAARIRYTINDLEQAVCDTCSSREGTQREIATETITLAKILLNATKHRVAGDSHLTEEESKTIVLSANEASQQLDRIRPADTSITTLLMDTLESLEESTTIITSAHRRMAHEEAGAQLVLISTELKRKTQDPMVAIHALEDPNVERLISEINTAIRHAIQTYEQGEDHLERHSYEHAHTSTQELSSSLTAIKTLTEMIP